MGRRSGAGRGGIEADARGHNFCVKLEWRRARARRAAGIGRLARRVGCPVICGVNRQCMGAGYASGKAGGERRLSAEAHRPASWRRVQYSREMRAPRDALILARCKSAPTAARHALCSLRWSSVAQSTRKIHGPLQRRRWPPPPRRWRLPRGPEDRRKGPGKAGHGKSGAHDATATKREAQKRDKFGAPLNYGPYRNGYYVGGDKPKREVEEAVSNGVAAELQAIVQQVNRADAAPPQRVAAALVAPPRRARSKRPVAAAAATEERRIDAPTASRTRRPTFSPSMAARASGKAAAPAAVKEPERRIDPADGAARSALATSLSPNMAARASGSRQSARPPERRRRSRRRRGRARRSKRRARGSSKSRRSVRARPSSRRC